MSHEQTSAVTGGETKDEKNSSEESKRRGRSTIEFPYMDLDEAVTVARGLHAIGGSGQFDQLAAQLQQAANSSMFNLRLNTARIFGLVTYSQQLASLTPLGHRICDPEQEQASKAEAFLTVPLYKAIHELYKGKLLPPTGGLESAMANAGVAEKQKGKARQVFNRAASQAGFFKFGANRLVLPAGAKGSPETPPPGQLNGDERKDTKDNSGGDGGSGEYHPLIKGLIMELPKTAGTPWGIEERKTWLELAANVFKMIYKGEPDQGAIKIQIEKSSAN